MDARTETEINELIDKCTDIEAIEGTRFPGMYYEQGIKDALLWILGEDGLEDELN